MEDLSGTRSAIHKWISAFSNWRRRLVKFPGSLSMPRVYQPCAREGRNAFDTCADCYVGSRANTLGGRAWRVIPLRFALSHVTDDD